MDRLLKRILSSNSIHYNPARGAKIERLYNSISCFIKSNVNHTESFYSLPLPSMSAKPRYVPIDKTIFFTLVLDLIQPHLSEIDKFHLRDSMNMAVIESNFNPFTAYPMVLPTGFVQQLHTFWFMYVMYQVFDFSVVHVTLEFDHARRAVTTMHRGNRVKVESIFVMTDGKGVSVVINLARPQGQRKVWDLPRGKNVTGFKKQMQMMPAGVDLGAEPLNAHHRVHGYIAQLEKSPVNLRAAMAGRDVSAVDPGQKKVVTQVKADLSHGLAEIEDMDERSDYLKENTWSIGERGYRWVSGNTYNENKLAKRMQSEDRHDIRGKQQRLMRNFLITYFKYSIKTYNFFYKKKNSGSSRAP